MCCAAVFCLLIVTFSIFNSYPKKRLLARAVLHVAGEAGLDYVSKFHSNGYRGTLSVNSAEILAPLKYELRNMSYELRTVAKIMSYGSELRASGIGVTHIYGSELRVTAPS